MRSSDAHAVSRAGLHRWSARVRALVACGTLLGCGLLLRPDSAVAQESEGARPPVPVLFEVFAGSELEGYLRALQGAGHAEAYPWSLRGFSAADVERMEVAPSGHPWSARYRFDGGEVPTLPSAPGRVGVEYGLVRPATTAIYNSGFPFGGNDGPVWAGRGVTNVVQVGGFARAGPLSLVLAPVAFRSQNRGFALAETGLAEDGVYRSPLSPRNIDLPQRFGDDPYARLDWGNSTLRLDGLGVAAGVSTAAQQWGPAASHPLLLGANAGGFPHVFVGTERPLNIRAGHVHARYIAGRLQGSGYSPSATSEPNPLVTGLVVVLLPRGLSGLEVGFGRFIHRPWPEDGDMTSALLEPLGFYLKSSNPEWDSQPDNHLASVFARWSVPGAGIEISGEFVRIDHAFDSRVLVLEPDDLSGYALGMRRVWEGQEQLTVFRGELFSTVSSHRERGGARQQLAFRGRPMYQHSPMVHGHTHRGQLLASPGGHGGAGSTVGIDRYHPGGRWTLEWERRVERDRTTGAGTTGSDLADVDVSYALGGSVVRFTGPVDLELGVRGVYNLNRHLRDDAFNLNLRLEATVSF